MVPTNNNIPTNMYPIFSFFTLSISVQLLDEFIKNTKLVYMTNVITNKKTPLKRASVISSPFPYLYFIH